MSGSGSIFVIENTNNSYLKGEKNLARLNLWLVKNQQSLRLDRVGGYLIIFVVWTMFMFLSENGFLWNGLCSAEHHGLVVSTKPAPRGQELLSSSSIVHSWKLYCEYECLCIVFWDFWYSLGTWIMQIKLILISCYNEQMWF